MNRAPFRYQIILFVLAPVVLLHLCYSAWRRQGGSKYILQRLSIYHTNIVDRPYWIHAASVGEINASLPLLELLFARYPNIKWLVTTNTATGERTVKKKLGHNVEHAYLPLDYKLPVQRFINHFRPRCALIVETELWPNLFTHCHAKQITLTLINGRLSKRSLNNPPFLQRIAAYCAQLLSTVLARSEADAKGFRQLGVQEQRLQVIGNIKYSGSSNDIKSDIELRLPRNFVLAASTHSGEEKAILKIWKKLQNKDWSLVIAPRYPERRNEIRKEIESFNFSYQLRSQNTKPDLETDIFVLDSLGELTTVMAQAELVFMGGSLVPRGGQNVLEPARLGKAIITGPHHFTFKEDIDALLEANAIICIDNEQQLEDTINKLLQSPKQLQLLGNNAKQFMADKAGIAEDYMQALEKLGLFR